jgi:hypothetical protein
VGAVNAKVDTLNTALEATQARTRQAQTKTAAVDAKAGNATTVVDGRVTAVEARARRLIYEVTLSEDQGNFLFNGAPRTTSTWASSAPTWSSDSLRTAPSAAAQDQRDQLR